MEKKYVVKDLFQFQFGAIKRSLRQLVPFLWYVFQFQFGAIKSIA